MSLLNNLFEILNRLGYRLRKVVKAKPLKKIKETDAIFDNVHKKDKWANPAMEQIGRAIRFLTTIKVMPHANG